MTFHLHVPLCRRTLFAATFIGALTSGLQDRVPDGGPFGGIKTENTIRDASLGGMSAVMARLSERIEKEIDDNGFYTRVPAGKQFYLYVQQDINPDDWSFGPQSQDDEAISEDLLQNPSFLEKQICLLEKQLSKLL